MRASHPRLLTDQARAMQRAMHGTFPLWPSHSSPWVTSSAVRPHPTTRLAVVGAPGSTLPRGCRLPSSRAATALTGGRALRVGNCPLGWRGASSRCKLQHCRGIGARQLRSPPPLPAVAAPVRVLVLRRRRRVQRRNVSLGGAPGRDHSLNSCFGCRCCTSTVTRWTTVRKNFSREL